ncbi:MAG: hypothetical protein ABI818_09120 [Acidobacteriota bacterium]
MRFRRLLIAGLAAATLPALVRSQSRGNPNEWPTAHGDAQHTSWIRTDSNISTQTMSQPGFALQWTSKLDIPKRPASSLTPGVVTSAVTLFTPISLIAAPDDTFFAVDNDTGNVFWTRHVEGTVPAATTACPGGISGAPSRVVNLVTTVAPAGRGGAGRGARSYSSAVGEPGEGVPLPAPTGARGAGRAGGAEAAAPPVPAAGGQQTPQGPAAGGVAAGQPGRGQGTAAVPPSPFPTNRAAQGNGGIWSPSGTVYAVSADGMFRRLGLASGKDVQRPARLLPAGARFSDLIAVGDMAYTFTSGSCGGAPNGLWAINLSGDPTSVVSWKTNGGDPLGSVAFSTTGTLVAAIGPGTPAAGGYANAIVALDPRTLTVKDWFTMPGVRFAAPPVLFQASGRDIGAVTTTDGRVLLLDVASLGGADHATPLFASSQLNSGKATFAPHAPAFWQEPMAVPPANANAAAGIDGARWLLLPIAGPLAAVRGALANGPLSTGAILAVKVMEQAGAFSVQPGWVSENLAAPLSPIVVNGVVFAVSGAQGTAAKLVALDGIGGKTLWQSGGVMRGPVSGRSFWTGSGHVFVGTLDGTVYAFGFDMGRGAPGTRAGS